MKRYIILMFLLGVQGIWAQQNDSLITLSYENSKLSAVLNQIEEQSDFRFYFISSWIQDYNDVSGNYNNTPINTVLKDLFEGTVINFYIMERNKIILTPNDIIYDTLPDRFFGESKDGITQNTNNNRIISPVFEKTKKPKRDRIETIRIGKTTKGIAKQRFILSGYIKNIYIYIFWSQTDLKLEDYC